MFFMQTRFQDARHVYSSFQDMLKMYIEREKSLDDVIWAVYIVLLWKYMPFYFSFLLCDTLFNYDFNSSGFFTFWRPWGSYWWVYWFPSAWLVIYMSNSRLIICNCAKIGLNNMEIIYYLYLLFLDTILMFVMCEIW